ncbi:hypothetical protein B9Z55_023159 [Caenorhabditis nigoni]|uniref:Peptidase A2 domain-containing protein n=1 Tax=Caenorhabditis nigoni TaxID=1611254 RepID=A0A2G5SNG0_9PELO|nr:hypothetical protein B9Z55_023159 [Caenorhabditis nigoni]
MDSNLEFLRALQLTDAPRYDDNETFSSYVGKLNVYFNAHHFSLDDAFRCLPYLLSEKARKAYNKLPISVREGPWNNLLDELRAAIETKSSNVKNTKKIYESTNFNAHNFSVHEAFRCLPYLLSEIARKTFNKLPISVRDGSWNNLLDELRAAKISLPYAHIQIGNKGIVALWDSGSNVSYLNFTTATRLNIEMQPAKIHSARAANGTSFHFLGTIYANVKIGSTSLEHYFLVTEDQYCPANALLGIDFMAALDRKDIVMSLRPVARKLQIGEVSIDLVAPTKKIYESTNFNAHNFSLHEAFRCLPYLFSKKTRKTFNKLPISVRDGSYNNLLDEHRAAIDTKSSNVKTSRKHVHIQIGNKGIVALWDSGASVSYLNFTTATRLDIEMQPAKTHSARAVNGTSIHFLGAIHAEVKIGSTSFKHKFLVTEDQYCPANALLGIDFMAALERKGIVMSLRPAARKLQIGKVSIDLVAPNKKIYESTNSVLEMMSADNVSLEPDQICAIRVNTSVNSPEDHLESTLSVLNFSSATILLKKGEVIATRKTQLHKTVQGGTPCKKRV